jgi:hypothetical protein
MGAAKAEKVSYMELVEVLDEWYVATGGKRKQKHRLALYRCTFNGCGKLVKRRQGEVRNKHVQSCGCYGAFLSKTQDGSANRKDYAGKQIGRFHILDLIGSKSGFALWRAICLECATHVEITSQQIHNDYSPCHCHQKPMAILNGRKARIRNMLRDIQFYKENPALKGASK